MHELCLVCAMKFLHDLDRDGCSSIGQPHPLLNFLGFGNMLQHQILVETKNVGSRVWSQVF